MLQESRSWAVMQLAEECRPVFLRPCPAPSRPRDANANAADWHEGVVMVPYTPDQNHHAL